MARSRYFLLFIAILLFARTSLSGISPAQTDAAQAVQYRTRLVEALVEKGLDAEEAADLVADLSDVEVAGLVEDEGLIDAGGMRGKYVVTFVIIGLMAAAAAATLMLAEDTGTESNVFAP